MTFLDWFEQEIVPQLEQEDKNKDEEKEVPKKAPNA